MLWGRSWGKNVAYFMGAGELVAHTRGVTGARGVRVLGLVIEVGFRVGSPRWVAIWVCLLCLCL